jgi:hypothetical protein
LTSKIKDLTLEDAMKAHEAGINFVCGDGKLQQVKGNLARQIVRILETRGE